MATDRELVQILWELAAQPAPQPWCSIHQCAPHDCFRLHHPTAFRTLNPDSLVEHQPVGQSIE